MFTKVIFKVCIKKELKTENTMKYILTTFTLLVLLSSCNKEEDPIIVYSDADLSIESIESRKEIRFHIEVLSDTINDLDRTQNAFDDCILLFDLNNNFELDSLGDFSLTQTIEGFVCESLLITQFVSKACNIADDITIESNFESSTLESNPHVIWDMTIPKNRFPSDQANLRVKISNPSETKAYPPYRLTQPIDFIYFDDTYEISWE